MVVVGGRANTSKRGKKMTRVKGNEEALVHLVPLLALLLDPLAPPLCTRRGAGLEEPNASQRKKKNKWEPTQEERRKLSAGAFGTPQRASPAPCVSNPSPRVYVMWEGPNASEKRTWKESRKQGAGVLGPVAFSWPRLPTPL